MTYQSYILFLNQFPHRKRMQCQWKEHDVWMEKSPLDDGLKISTKILSMSNVPLFLLQALTSQGSFKWQLKGAYLSVDRESDDLYLIQEVAYFRDFLPFKGIMTDFTQLATEWKQSLQDLAM
ncbi:MAG: hypothetical protein NTZ52_07315 [Chlamydiae bacterium]|nr:hypothetical protein [Chlamydiota bacterium]